MNTEKINKLYDLYSEKPADLKKIENYVINEKPTVEEITVSLVDFMYNRCYLEYKHTASDNLSDDYYFYSDNLFDITALLLKYGLDIHMEFIYTFKNGFSTEKSVLSLLPDIDVGTVAPRLLKMFLEIPDELESNYTLWKKFDENQGWKFLWILEYFAVLNEGIIEDDLEIYHKTGFRHGLQNVYMYFVKLTSGFCYPYHDIGEEDLENGFKLQDLKRFDEFYLTANWDEWEETYAWGHIYHKESGLLVMDL